MSKRKASRFAVSLMALIAPALAHAHADLAGAGGFEHGFLHPLGGLDHLLAMVAVGIWAAQLGGRAVLAVPASFVVAMALGSGLAFGGFSLPFLEHGILASVAILGLAIAAAWRLPLGWSAALVAAFALFHGVAHGAEIPLGASGLAYAAGFAVSTGALHLSGVGLAASLQRARAELVRLAGACVALGGLFLAA